MRDLSESNLLSSLPPQATTLLRFGNYSLFWILWLKVDLVTLSVSLVAVFVNQVSVAPKGNLGVDNHRVAYFGNLSLNLDNLTCVVR